jgi:hypothetical protein
MSSSFLSSSSPPPAVIILCKHDNRLVVELRSSDTFDKDDDNFGLLKFKSTFIHSFIQVVSGYYSHPFRIWVSVFVLVSVPHRLLPISLLSNKNIKYVSPDRWSINIMELHKQSTSRDYAAHTDEVFFFSSSFLFVGVSNVQKHFTGIAI